MHLLRQAYEFEYRAPDGVERAASVDLWITASGSRAAVILRGCSAEDACAALQTLHHT